MAKNTINVGFKHVPFRLANKDTVPTGIILNWLQNIKMLSLLDIKVKWSVFIAVFPNFRQIILMNDFLFTKLTNYSLKTNMNSYAGILDFDIYYLKYYSNLQKWKLYLSI